MNSDTQRPGYASPAEGLAFLLAQEGGCTTLNAAAVALNTDSSIVAEMLEHGEAIGYRDNDGEYHLPVWQFTPAGGFVAGIAEVLAEIRAVLPGGDVPAVVKTARWMAERR